MADDLGDEYWLDGDNTGGQGDIEPDGTFARHNDVFTVFISVHINLISVIVSTFTLRHWAA